MQVRALLFLRKLSRNLSWDLVPALRSRGCGPSHALPAAQLKSETRKILNSNSNSVFELSFELVFYQVKRGKLKLTQLTQLFCADFLILFALNFNSDFRPTQLNSVLTQKLSYGFLQVSIGFWWLNSETQLNSTFLGKFLSLFSFNRSQLNFFWLKTLTQLLSRIWVRRSCRSRYVLNTVNSKTQLTQVFLHNFSFLFCFNVWQRYLDSKLSPSPQSYIIESPTQKGEPWD